MTFARSFTAFAAALLAASLAAVRPVRGAPSTCGPQVQRDGAVVRVSPGGVDDTAALQCAFDLAVGSGEAATIRLAPGTFYTQQVVVVGFHGTFEGAGSHRTTLRNTAAPLPVNPLDFMYDGAPSSANRWPDLLAFVGGDFTIRDLAIRVVGATPTTGWSVFGLEPFPELHAAIVIVGDRARATVERVDIEGEAEPAGISENNLIQGIYFQGLIGPEFRPISGSFTVRDSRFAHSDSTAPVSNARGAQIRFERNAYEDTRWGNDFSDVVDSSITVVGNAGSSFMGFDLWAFCWGGESVCGFDGTRVQIADNAVEATFGVVLETDVGAGGGACHVVGNHLASELIDVYLGPETVGCQVAGNTAGASVLDLGTDNHVVGAADGPRAHPRDQGARTRSSRSWLRR